MSRLLDSPPRHRPPQRRPASHRRPPRMHYWWVLVALGVLTAGALLWRTGTLGSLLESDRSPAAGGRQEPGGGTNAGPSGSPDGSPSPTPAPTTTPGPINAAFPGLTTFRGNATRSYYGEGPVPAQPVIGWRYPESGGLCSESTNEGVTKLWCGTGWTGQPNVLQHDDGTVEVRFGAYDSNYHFLDALTGDPILSDLETGDLAKGSATSDPDGFPLYYAGSRDNHMRVMALDRPEPTTLWSMSSDSAPNPVWNSDWDGAPLIVDDHMLVGGENSWFYVVKLNRGYDAQGLVKVDPKIVMLVPGYDEQLFADVGDQDVSIESSVSFHDGVAYFVNSGGLVQGWDIRDVLRGGSNHERVFRFWVGDDADASIAIDEEGYLYVARHGETSRGGGAVDARNREIGDLVKLDPRRPDDPVVWSVHVTGGSAEDGGLWGTPAIYNKTVFITTNYGEVVAVSQESGRVFWKFRLPGPLWGSPVPVDDRLIVGDCNGVLHAYDISNRWSVPPEVWSIQLDGCIESTPAVWRGWIYLGTRGGPMYGITDSSTSASPSG